MNKKHHPKLTPKVITGAIPAPLAVQGEPEHIEGHETAELRKTHPIVVFVVKEARSIVLALAVGGVGISSCITGDRQSSDTKWVGQHLSAKEERIDQLEARVTALENRLGSDSDAVGKNKLTETNNFGIVAK